MPTNSTFEVAAPSLNQLTVSADSSSYTSTVVCNSSTSKVTLENFQASTVSVTITPSSTNICGVSASSSGGGNGPIISGGGGGGGGGYYNPALALVNPVIQTVVVSPSLPTVTSPYLFSRSLYLGL